MDKKESIFNEHLYQFIITLVIVVSYVLTNLQGRSTALLENVVLLGVSYWFISSNNRVVTTSATQLDNKINAVAQKISTAEIEKAKTDK